MSRAPLRQAVLPGLEQCADAPAIEVLLDRPVPLFWVAVIPELGVSGAASHPRGALEELACTALDASRRIALLGRPGPADLAWRILRARDTGSLAGLLENSARLADD